MKKLLFFTTKLLILVFFIYIISHVTSWFSPRRYLDDPTWWILIYRIISSFYCLNIGLIILKKLSPDLRKQKIIIMIIIFLLTIFIFDWQRFVDRVINDRTRIVEKTSTQILCSGEEFNNRRICDSESDKEIVFLEDSDTLVIRHIFQDVIVPEFESIWGRNPMEIRLRESTVSESIGSPTWQLIEIRIDFKEDISLENTEIYVYSIFIGGYEIPIE